VASAVTAQRSGGLHVAALQAQQQLAVVLKHVEPRHAQLSWLGGQQQWRRDVQNGGHGAGRRRCIYVPGLPQAAAVHQRNVAARLHQHRFAAPQRLA
jgi:hypothetical protein